MAAAVEIAPTLWITAPEWHAWWESQELGTKSSITVDEIRTLFDATYLGQMALPSAQDVRKHRQRNPDLLSLTKLMEGCGWQKATVVGIPKTEA